ncbi:MAG: hypothetical protein ABI947_01040 [Chloroflexota bacterium]
MATVHNTYSTTKPTKDTQAMVGWITSANETLNKKIRDVIPYAECVSEYGFTRWGILAYVYPLFVSSTVGRLSLYNEPIFERRWTPDFKKKPKSLTFLGASEVETLARLVQKSKGVFDPSLYKPHLYIYPPEQKAFTQRAILRCWDGALFAKIQSIVPDLRYVQTPCKRYGKETGEYVCFSNRHTCHFKKSPAYEIEDAVLTTIAVDLTTVDHMLKGAYVSTDCKAITVPEREQYTTQEYTTPVMWYSDSGSTIIADVVSSEAVYIPATPSRDGLGRWTWENSREERQYAGEVSFGTWSKHIMRDLDDTGIDLDWLFGSVPSLDRQATRQLLALFEPDPRRQALDQAMTLAHAKIG